MVMVRNLEPCGRNRGNGGGGGRQVGGKRDRCGRRAQPICEYFHFNCALRAASGGQDKLGLPGHMCLASALVWLGLFGSGWVCSGLVRSGRVWPGIDTGHTRTQARPARSDLRRRDADKTSLGRMIYAGSPALALPARLGICFGVCACAWD